MGINHPDMGAHEGARGPGEVLLRHAEPMEQLEPVKRKSAWGLKPEVSRLTPGPAASGPSHLHR